MGLVLVQQCSNNIGSGCTSVPRLEPSSWANRINETNVLHMCHKIRWRCREQEEDVGPRPDTATDPLRGIGYFLPDAIADLIEMDLLLALVTCGWPSTWRG